MKIWEIIKTDFDPEKPIEEGWKENVLATVISVASLFDNAKAQNNPLISKSNQEVRNDIFRLDIGKSFGSGRYNFTDDELKSIGTELRKLGGEIVKNPTSDFLVEIVASESQVRNYDMEPTSKTYKGILKSGELAKKRSETAQFIIQKFADELKKDGVLKGEFKFVATPKILIGNVPWPEVDKSTGKKRSSDDPAYKKDQFVFANVKIIPRKQEEKNEFSAYASIGEGIYFNNKLFGVLFVDSRQTNDIKISGNKNTGYETILFKTVKPNTSLTGRKDEKGVYLKSYVIPWQWWNKNVFNTRLSQENVEYILKNFEAK